MYHKLKLLILLIGISMNLFSQTDIPEIIPSSPEVYGLGQYGDIPVSTYTGVPDISIPIHTVKIGGLSLPITLSYHATGIHVSQEASWVGLGWNLIAGGGISYIPVGKNDKLVYNQDWNDLKFFLDYVFPDATYPTIKFEDWFILWGCSGSTEHPELYECYGQDQKFYNLIEGDGEQDVYSANFLNYSFKFIKTPRDGSFLFLGQKNKCIIDTIDGSNGIEITGEDGTIYEFNCIESNSVIGGTARLGWFLTKIIHPTGDEITLKYSRIPTLYIPPLSEYISVCKPYADEAVRNISQDYLSPSWVPYLDTIETKNEWVIFEKDTSRDDLNGGARLTRIIIKDRITQAEVFSYEFHTGYFTGVSTGGNYLTDRSIDAGVASNFTDDNVQKRLKLDSIVQYAGSLRNEKYVFKYNESVSLPYKTSFAIDHWGFYNGQDNGGSAISNCHHTIIPSIASLTPDNPPWIDDVPTSLYSISGANRGASKDYITAGMLESIQYPTGGKTVFEFEPHDFNNHKYISAEDEIEYISGGYNEIKKAGVIVYPGNPTYDVTEDEFTIDESALVDFNGNLYAYQDPYITIEAVDAPGDFSTIFFNINNVTSSPEDGHWVWGDSFWLKPGTYKLKCYAPNSYPLVEMGPVIEGTLSTWKYFENNSDLSNIPSIGGGIRIKNITSYDENGTIVSSKRYSYVNNNGTTSGKLLPPLRYIKSKDVRVGGYAGGYYSYTSTKFTLSGNSYIPLSGLSYGNNVGYSRVEVESYSGSDNNGKEIFAFSNNEATVFENKISYYGHVTNGNLKSRTVLNNLSDTILVERNSYSIVPGSNTIEKVNALIEDHYIGPVVCDLAYIGRYGICTYPTENYFNALTKKETIHYFPTGKVKKTEYYTYSPDNYKVSETLTTNSKGESQTSYYYYPPDYPSVTSGWIAEMNDANMINKPIETLNKKNDKYVSGQHIIYNTGTYLGKPNKAYSLKALDDWSNFTASNNDGGYHFETDEYDLQVTYDQYDESGNLLQFTAKDGTPTVYLWGYNKTLPVAKIVNATLDVVQNALPGNSIDFGISGLSETQRQALYTAEELKLAIITIYEYKPLVGITAEYDPNGRKTTYEYDDFGRLILVKNQDGKVVESYDYHYYNETE